MPIKSRTASGQESEASFQSAVFGLAAFYGWRHYHAPDNRPNASGRVQSVVAGFPDGVLLRDAELIVAEFKTDTGKLGPGQAEWLEAWQTFGAAVAHAVDLAAGLEAAGELEDLDRPAAYPPTVDVYVWRPRDWRSVEARLARGRTLMPSVHRG